MKALNDIIILTECSWFSFCLLSCFCRTNFEQLLSRKTYRPTNDGWFGKENCATEKYVPHFSSFQTVTVLTQPAGHCCLIHNKNIGKIQTSPFLV